MTTTQPAPQLPFDRPDVLQVAPLYDVLRREAPIVAAGDPGGDPAWLVTRYEQCRELCADPASSTCTRRSRSRCRSW